MYALDNSSGVSVMPAIAGQLSTGLFFTEGGDGQEPSYPGADWYNIVQSELIAVLTEAGISPSKTVFLVVFSLFCTPTLAPHSEQNFEPSLSLDPQFVQKAILFSSL